jgi:CMP/dCMP kinase
MNQSIVINREYASGGREIGRLIAEQTGQEFYDTRILQEAALRQEYSEEILASFDEQFVGGGFLDFTLLGGNAELAALPYRIHGAITAVVTAAAIKAPAVFIGRCADQILLDAKLPVLSVFIYSSDLQQRIARAVEVDGVDPKHAEAYIAKMDRSRRRYQQFFTDAKFGDPQSYDLCLNSAKLSYDACARAIIACG